MTKKGLQLVFIGALVQAIGTLVALVPAISILGSIAILVGFILYLVGLKRAGTEHTDYARALKLIIINIIVTIVGMIVALVFVLISPLLSIILGILVSLVSALLDVLVIMIIINTTNTLVSESTAKFGNLVKIIYLVGVVLGFILGSIVKFVPDLKILSILTSIIGVAYLVCFIIYLAKAKNEVA